MSVLRVIEAGENSGPTRITTYPGQSGKPAPARTVPGSFWDVVGDTLLTAAVRRILTGEVEDGLCCLAPGPGEPEGLYYSRDVLEALLRRSREADGWDYLLWEGGPIGTDDIGTAENTDGIPRAAFHPKKDRTKEDKEGMSGSVELPSLKDYRRDAPRGADGPSPAGAAERLPSLREYARERATVSAVSPLSGGDGALVPEKARSRALAFAHPVDRAVIRALDNPTINAVFNKVVQTSIDASYGLTLATGIHVSQHAYRDLYAIVVDCARSLGIPVPYVIISDSVRGLNACTAGTNQFAFIAISSMLPLVLKREELQFVIGHECGHLALGHVVYHTALNVMGTAGGLLPLVGPIITRTVSVPLNAWGRRSEISADRAGLICCGDAAVAKRALFRLEAGLLNVDGVDIDEYVRESERMLENTSIGKFAEIGMEHPIIPKRIKALDLFARSEVYARSLGRAAEPDSLSEARLAQETEKIIEIM